MRKQIVAGNWKMNKTFIEAEDLLNDLKQLLENSKHGNTLVVVCPPNIYLELSTDISDEFQVFDVGAQNVCNIEFGAHTGEVSAPMLFSMDVKYCIIGHSERRSNFYEDNQLISGKVGVALKNKITPIFCCGEQISERKAENHFNIIKTQVDEGLFNLDKDDFVKVVMAYEPVWAIGTGVTATPEQAQEMHKYIRSLIEKKYGTDIAGQTTILYGGSCNSKNAKELFANPDVDGGLIGGASLNAEEFVKIVQSF